MRESSDDLDGSAITAEREHSIEAGTELSRELRAMPRSFGLMNFQCNSAVGERADRSLEKSSTAS